MPPFWFSIIAESLAAFPMQRIAVIVLIITSLLPYLEWGNQSAFLFQMEYEILFSGKHGIENLVHPAIVLPLAGQVLLLISVFQKAPKIALVIPGIVLLGILILLVLLTGILSKNPRIQVSTLPFFACTGWYFLKAGRSKSTL